MTPINARWRIRGLDDFTVEERARLQQKLEGWIRQRVPQTERTRRRTWLVMKPKTAHPAEGATPRDSQTAATEGRQHD